MPDYKEIKHSTPIDSEGSKYIISQNLKHLRSRHIVHLPAGYARNRHNVREMPAGSGRNCRNVREMLCHTLERICHAKLIKSKY